MRIISRRPLKEFAAKHADAEPALNDWYKLTAKARWYCLDDVRKTYPHADLAGDCTVFNVGGNKYRLITVIIYAVQRVYVRFVLTHAEYDRERWKHDCGC